MTPEAKARVSIDALLIAAGWHVCSVVDTNIHAAVGVAIREFPLNPGFGYADYLLAPTSMRWCRKSSEPTAACSKRFKREKRRSKTNHYVFDSY